MPSEGGTFSSAQLRERDKRIEEKHKQDIAALEKKIGILKRSNDDTRKQLFDEVQRSNRLAGSLGFSNIYEAQEALDLMESESSFKQCLERVQELENAMDEAKGETELYSQQLAEVMKELDTYRDKELKQIESQVQLTQDYDNLKQQHDALTLKFKRAAERYKQDYKKFNQLYQFLKTEDKKHRALCNQQPVTPAEKERLEALHIRSKIAVMEQVEVEIKGGSDGIVEFPEHLATPELRPSDMAYVTGSRTLVQQPLDRLKKYHAMPSTSPTLFTTAKRASSSREKLDVAASSETEEESTLGSPSHGPGRVPSFKLPGLPLSKLNVTTAVDPQIRNRPKGSDELDQFEVAASSETEAESICSPSHRPGKAQSFKLPGLPSSRLNRASSAGSSNTAASSRTLNPLKRPSSPTAVEKNDVAASSETEEESICAPQQLPLYKRPGVPLPKPRPTPAAASSDTEPESLVQSQPDVIDLVSSDTEPESLQCSQPELDAAKSSDTEPESLDVTPVKALSSSTTANVQRQVNTERPLKIRRVSGVEFGGNDISTPRPDENQRPARIVPQTEPGKTARPSDYSVFKGKGRYGRKSDAGPSTSVNSRFVIDPEKNGGLDYQYDEVVRGKENRKKMDAGTCECCKDYYEAVGPLPSRLQPPMWRSPSTTPTKQCQHHREREIEFHKKAISRHRHNWERAKTPPDYWNIGFPSTQEVGDINERAEQMHREKVLEIEREAANGTGKYRYRRK